MNADHNGSAPAVVAVGGGSVLDAAKARDLALSDATLANLMALGIDPQPEEDSLAVRWGITGGALHDPRAGTGG